MDHALVSDETLCAQLGDEIGNSAQAIVPPVYLTSLHAFESTAAMAAYHEHGGGYYYGRVSNPTVETVEKTLAALERGGDALCFGSGMAAITSAILHAVKAGDHIVAGRNCYGPAYGFMGDYLAALGIEVTFIAGRTAEDFDAARRPNTRLFYLESPGSLTFMMQDIAGIAALARSRGIVTAIDNTLPTPLYQKPLTLGVDISVHTMSKYIGGHGDIIGGALISSEERVGRIRRRERELFGGILGPMEAFLARRGLRTMPVRLRRHGENALRIAEYLEAHPKVARVFYTGLPSHPDYALGRRQMTGHSGLLSFSLKASEQEALAFIDRLRLFRIGVSWGGHESLALLTLRGATSEAMAAYGTDRPVVRMHAGLQGADELLADIEDSLAKVREA